MTKEKRNKKSKTSKSTQKVRIARKPTGLKRSRAVLQPAKKNTMRRRGYFAGGDIADKDREHLEPSELRSFFAKLAEPTEIENSHRFWYPYFYLQYHYGCRLSEPALMFDVDDVNIEKKQIVVKRLKKTSEEEDAGMESFVYTMDDDRVLAAVQQIRQWKRDEGLVDNPFLFPSRREQKVVGAERLSQLRNYEGFQAVSRFTAHRQFQRVARLCKLPPKLSQSHVLRNTRTVLLLASGMKPEEVQHRLGQNATQTWRFMGVAEAMRARFDAATLANPLGA